MNLRDYIISDFVRAQREYGLPATPFRFWNYFTCIFNPRMLPTVLYRTAFALECSSFTRLAKLMTWLNFYITGAEIWSKCKIGPGLFFPHSNGLVIGAKEIGKNATIYQQVAIGGRRILMAADGRPVIGDDVVVGSGAKILGDISVGANCVIAANTLVSTNMPDNSFAIGVPAKIAARASRNPKSSSFPD